MTLGFVEHEKCTCSSPISGFLVHHLLLKQNVGYAKKTWARRPQSEPNPQAFSSPLLPTTRCVHLSTKPQPHDDVGSFGKDE